MRPGISLRGLVHQSVGKFFTSMLRRIASVIAAEGGAEGLGETEGGSYALPTFKARSLQ